MRLMLGFNGKPSLLVNVKQEHSPAHFEFEVINGRWDGTYTDGYITVHHPWEPFSSLDKMEILCDNQDRLRSSSNWDRGYETVFENFNNPNYVAPKPKPVVFDDMDDDIPF